MKTKDPFILAFEKRSKMTINKVIAHGCVYSIKKYPNRVVKIEAMDSYYNGDDKSIVSRIKYFKNKKYSHVVKIFDVGIFTFEQVKYYYYVMEKLKPLPDNSCNRIINTFENFYRSGRKISKKLSRAMQTFIAKSNKMQLYYADLHAGNVMMDRNGNYKFIDLESFTF